MKNKIENFGINIFYISFLGLGGLFIFDYLPELFRIIFSKSTLNGNIFNYTFLIFWNLTTMSYFVNKKIIENKKIDEEHRDIPIYITGWLSIILFVIYLGTYNQVVDYEKEPIQKIIYFNLPWIYFFFSWINLRYINSKIK